MASPISGFIAEAVLQRLESLVFQHHRPKFWARYVDDTFVVIERDQVLTFQEHLNAVFPDIQFTMEEEENNQLAFLDVLVCRKDCGGLKTKVFRKATNTMQLFKEGVRRSVSCYRPVVIATCSQKHTGLSMTDDTFYSFICKDIDGNVTDLNPYSQGLAILAFPCNQFGAQEPETENVIKKNMQEKYKVTFDMFSKCEVNGSDAHPLFTYLKKSLVDTEKPDITWNFAKFLVDRKGMPYKRYPPDFAPQDMEPDILHLLSR
nr:unnamed protein product [Spirometra erinaceieuropaei]